MATITTGVIDNATPKMVLQSDAGAADSHRYPVAMPHTNVTMIAFTIRWSHSGR
jgi:hypothetical protein